MNRKQVIVLSFLLLSHSTYTMEKKIQQLEDTIKKDVHILLDIVDPTLEEKIEGEQPAITNNTHKKTTTSVRKSNTISTGEREYLKKRMPVVQAALNNLYGDISQKKTPSIACVFSGGGYRAMLCALGSLYGLEQEKLLPCITYTVGLSGSTWAIAPWLSTKMSLHSFKQYLPQIALSTSRDGGATWSVPVRVNQTPKKSPNPQAFTPFVAVDHESHVGVLYSDFRKNKELNADDTMTKTNTWLAIFKETLSPTGGSTGVGLNFKKEHRMSNESYIAQNGPQTTQGIMTNGDYSFLVASNERFYAIYTQSFDGSFTDPVVVLDVGGSTVSLDNNLRTAPFFSREKGSSK
jgi:hypothetical protein